MNNPHKGRSGIERLVHATHNSVAGLRTAWREESAFRQELVVALLLAPLALWIGQGWLELSLLWGTLLLVLIVELLNSGIEAAVDRISFDHHALSAKAKDMASAAVMLSLLLCAGVWLAAAYAAWQR